MFVFNTKQIGQRIRAARNKQNLTQMALADQMGVSFQAVSNWERGNSMPDISKLEQLCSVLQISLPDLLGSDPSQTETLQRLQKQELPPAEDLAPIAPLVPPETLQASVQETAKERALPWETLLSMAPFLGEEFLGELIGKQQFHMPLKALQSLAPFLDEASIDRLALSASEEGDLCQLCGLAPFVSGETLGTLVLRQLNKADAPDTGALSGLYPFLEQDDMQKIARKLMENGDLEALRDAAPFL